MIDFMTLEMLPGPKYLLLGAILSAVVLLAMGVFSYFVFKKEKEKRIAAWRAEKRAELAAQAEKNMVLEAKKNAAPASNAAPKPAPAPQPAPQPAPAPAPKPANTPAPKPRSTRNDFDFKF